MGVSTERFSWLLACVATYAITTNSLITWLPRRRNSSETYLEYGWSTRLGGWMTIAIGNNAEVVALGAGARALGTLFVAAAAFLPVAVVLVAIRWADADPRHRWAAPPRDELNWSLVRVRRGR